MLSKKFYKFIIMYTQYRSDYVIQLNSWPEWIQELGWKKHLIRNYIVDIKVGVNVNVNVLN